MKRCITVIAAFLAVLSFIIVHSVVMLRLADDIKELSENVIYYAEKGKWQSVETILEKIDRKWESRRVWASLTIRTNDIEQIEIALEQSRKFAEIKALPDFAGEFTMFSKLVEHIPHQEGFHIEEIL